MENITKNKEYKVIIDGWSNTATGVCHIDGRAVFIPYAVLGEEWIIKILKVTKTAIYGKGITLLKPSESRVEPECKYFSKCGGCDTWHINYDEELKFKLSSVNNTLHHVGNQEYLIDTIIPGDCCTNYRNKSITAVGYDNDKICSGFYRERSHNIINIENCLIQTELSNRVSNVITDWMESHKIKPYDEMTEKGSVRHIFTRSSIHTNEAVTCIISATGFGKHTQSLVDCLTEKCPELTGIVLNVNRNDNNTVLYGDFYTLWGSDVIHDSLCGLEFEISPQSFYQVNPNQAEKLYNKAIEFANLSGKETVLDLYCGTGTISLCLARKAKHVIGVEIIPEAIENAKKNAKNNEITNVEFVCGNSNDIKEIIKNKNISVDTIVVDPPRKGLQPEAIRSIVEINPQKIVYVSCNPSTLARDIKILSDSNYKLSDGVAVDMFPKTHHVETVVLMTKTLS